MRAWLCVCECFGMFDEKWTNFASNGWKMNVYPIVIIIRWCGNSTATVSATSFHFQHTPCLKSPRCRLISHQHGIHISSFVQNVQFSRQPITLFRLFWAGGRNAQFPLNLYYNLMETRYVCVCVCVCVWCAHHIAPVHDEWENVLRLLPFNHIHVVFPSI